MKFHASFSLLTAATFSAFTNGERNDVGTLEEQQEGGGSGGLRGNNNRALTVGLHIPIESKIVGGTNAPFDAYPFFVSWNGCGASLVASDVILSAAHCRGQSTNQVSIGKSRNGFNSNGLTRIITTRNVHPNYVSSSIDYDYMVMKLNEPVDTSLYPPIGLNRESNVPYDNEILTVIGFGTLSAGGSTPSQLKQVNVSYIPTEECNTYNGYDGDVKDATMFCAGTNTGGKDSCQGDSGGPIFTNREPIEQVGIVSWGIGCAQQLYPGVYSRISGEYDWIKEQVCDLASDKPAYCTNENNNPGSSPGPGLSTTLAPVPEPGPILAPGPDDNNSGEVSVSLEIFYDRFPTEISWAFEQDGQIVLSRERGSITSPGREQYEVTFSPGDVTFTIEDSYGDGICCSYLTTDSGRGYEITDTRSNTMLAENDGSFGRRQVDEFEITSGSDPSESDPSESDPLESDPSESDPLESGPSESNPPGSDPLPASPEPSPAPTPVSVSASGLDWWCEIFPNAFNCSRR